MSSVTISFYKWEMEFLRALRDKLKNNPSYAERVSKVLLDKTPNN